jgi:glycosyltransferase involved in cell wall biosynthesis
MISLKKKICHLSSGHPVEIRIFYKECAALKAAGYDVSLIALHDTNEVLNGVPIYGLSTPKSLLYRVTKTVWDIYWRALKEDAEVYHFHDPELIICGLFLKLHGETVIYDVHEDVPRQIFSKRWIPRILRKFISVCFEKYENIASMRFDAIVAATPSIGDRFLKQGMRVAVVNNYPILDDLSVPCVDWALKEKAVCYVGGVSKERGICEILEALVVSNIKLLFAGWFSSEEEEKAVTSMSGWKYVQNYGKVGREQVKEVLSKSMAGLVLFHPEPNHVNSQPNKLFEYMYAGIPVIASNFPLWQDVIEKNQCGLCVDPLDKTAIASAITYFIDNPNVAREMGNNGRKAIEQKYNWEAESIKLISLYQQL